MEKLITNIAARFPDLTKEDISLSVEIIIDAMSERLINGGRIELRGFGSFSMNARLQSQRSNLAVEINDSVLETPLVHFKPGVVIRKNLDNAI